MQIYFLNVSINVSINNCSFKYICVVPYLKIRFRCFTYSVNNFRDFNSKIEMLLVFQNKSNIEIISF